MEKTPDRRRMLQCRIHPTGKLQTYKYVVVCSNYQGKWLMSRHKKRDTWETQGEHIEAGETPMDAARRELYEESGVLEAELYPVCDYYGYDATGHANGMVFLAVIHQLGELPESEMSETRLFEQMPDNLTYPNVTPLLYTEAAKLLEKRKTVKRFTPEYRQAFVQMLSTYFTDDLNEDWTCEVVERISEFILSQWRDGILDILLLLEKEQTEGFAICQVDSLASDWCKREGWGFIREFYVAQESRLSGKGRFLAEQTEQLLKEKQAEQVYLTTSGALEFWLRCGYSIDFFDEKEKMYTMIKKLQ
ncbi:MAG: GNAT family N-acetyltransferase [Clostridia bacterium]|nr:GNAT family N-acetyltransferase [Clostridia bacterium]